MIVEACQISFTLFPLPFNLFVIWFVRGAGLTCKKNFDILEIFYNFVMQAEGNFRGNYITGMPLRKFPHGY